MQGDPDTKSEASFASISETEAHKAEENFPWSLEVALSGGGLRATAFCLGALLYLVHAGLNCKVRNIASVSGGSITNGFVACQCDYCTTDIETFRDRVAGELVGKVASHGMCQSTHVWLYAGAILLLTTGLVVLFLFP
jgi:NTE family protein